MLARGLRLVTLAGFVALALISESAKAQGDSSHYQTLQLGERSRGMAGAFTGFAADGAAIWFNPAGLPLLEPRLLQGSLSLIQIRKSTQHDGVTGTFALNDTTTTLLQTHGLSVEASLDGTISFSGDLAGSFVMGVDSEG